MSVGYKIDIINYSILIQPNHITSILEKKQREFVKFYLF